MTGLHHMTNAIDMTLTTKFGGTILWPMIALSNIAQGSSVLAMSVLQRHNARAAQVNVPACVSAYLGVTEPALFGVNLKYGFPLICGMIGSATAAVISVGGGVQALSIGVGGIPGILSINPQFWQTFALAMATAIVVPFILTCLVGQRRLSAAEKGHTPAPVSAELISSETFIAPMSGRLIALEDVADQGFASKSMGDGIGDLPTVIAPYSGTVTVAFPTGHAYGLACDNGREVLIHIGMDTVELGGKGFTARVKQGDRVRQGDVLAEVDLAYIKAQGKPLVSPIVFTDGEAITVRQKNVDVTRGEGGIIDL